MKSQKIMPEPTTTAVIFGGKEIVITCIGAVAAILGFNAKNVVNRLNKHDADIKEKVDKETYNETIKAIRAEIAKGIEKQETQIEKIGDKITQRIDKIVDKK